MTSPRARDHIRTGSANHDFAIFSLVDDYLTEEIQCMGGVNRGRVLKFKVIMIVASESFRMALEHSMAYVPGFAHDLFFSYAQHDSVEWIRALEEGLRQNLRDRLGLDVGIWRDKRSIQFGQEWPEEIREAVINSAAFLAIVSPSYHNSDWCTRERDLFIDHNEARGNLKAGSYHRFLKLVKSPCPGYEKFRPELQQVKFFDRSTDGEEEEEVEFIPSTSEFRARVHKAGHAIAALLTEMRRGREAVFVASTTEDCFQARIDLRQELHGKGYNVQPYAPPDKGSPALVQEHLEAAVLTVHILGTAYDPFVERQIDLAMELKKRMVSWITRGAENSQEERQRKLIEKCRNLAWLKSNSPRAVIDDILKMLHPQPAAPAAKANGDASRIYVLCDPSTPEDSALAQEIQAQIRQVEKMEVDLPLAGSRSVTARSDLHKKLLRECDGLLLCRRSAPEPWLREMFPDVVYAERLFERPPVRSKAFLLNDASLIGSFTGVPVIPQSQPFLLSDLDPFLAPLRKAGGVLAAS